MAANNQPERPHYHRHQCPLCDIQTIQIGSSEALVRHIWRDHLGIQTPIQPHTLRIFNNFFIDYIKFDQGAQWSQFAQVCHICNVRTNRRTARGNYPRIETLAEDRKHIEAHFSTHQYICPIHACLVFFRDAPNDRIHILPNMPPQNDQQHQLSTIQQHALNANLPQLGQLIELLQNKKATCLQSVEQCRRVATFANNEFALGILTGNPDRWTTLTAFSNCFREVFAIAGYSRILVRLISAASGDEIAQCCRQFTGLIYTFLTNATSSPAMSVLLIFSPDAFWTEFIQLFANERQAFLGFSELAHALRTILCHPQISNERYHQLTGLILPNNVINDNTDFIRSSFRSVILACLVARIGPAAEAVANYFLLGTRFADSAKGEHSTRVVRDLLNLTSHHREVRAFDELFKLAGRNLDHYCGDTVGNWTAQLLLYLAPDVCTRFVNTRVRLDYILPVVSNIRGQSALRRFDYTFINEQTNCHVMEAAILAGGRDLAHGLAKELLSEPDNERLRILTGHRTGNNILRRLFESIMDVNLCNRLQLAVKRILDESGGNAAKYSNYLKNLGRSRVLTLEAEARQQSQQRGQPEARPSTSRNA